MVRALGTAPERPGGGDRSIDPELARLLRAVVGQSASDLHLTVGRPPMIRVDGRLGPCLGEPILPAASIARMLESVLDPEKRQVLRAQGQVDLAVSLTGTGRFRLNAYRQMGSPAAAFRAVSDTIPTTRDIGLPPEVERVAQLPSGLVLFVGPTGSGKSTTQAALIGSVNASTPCHILTIEDPVEFFHRAEVALVTQREVGTDVGTFAEGLRAALREDPDLILLGEMRDDESVSIALTLAETGHLVFATLHSNDAAHAVDRILDTFQSDRRSQVRGQLAGVLRAVVSQRLAPRLGGGRLAAFEVLMVNDAVRNLIREGKNHQLRNVVATGRSSGMRTMEQSLNEMVAAGLISVSAALALTLYPKEIVL